MLERITAYADPERMSRDDSGETTPLEEPGAGREPNLVTSLLPNGRHAPALDIDFPCWVVPSSTQGHYHLYLDIEMTWEKYEALIRALVDAGVLGRGYAEHSLERGRTVLRMPWVNKYQPERAAGTEPALDIDDEPF